MSASEHASDSSTVFCVVGFCVVGCRCVRWLLCVDLATSVERKQTKKRKRAFCFVLFCVVVLWLWLLCAVACGVCVLCRCVLCRWLSMCSLASLCGFGYVDGEQTNKEKQEGVLFCFVLLCCGCGCCVLCFAGVGGFCT